MQAASVAISSYGTDDDDARYEGFLVAIRRRFATLAEAAPALFTTDATGLFDLFLANLPEDRRKHYTCNACRRFVERFGGLVTIADEGMTVPAMWSAIDGAKDTTYLTGAAFFPETLKSEYHPIRSTMEAYAQRSVLSGRDEATGARGSWNCTLRVTTKSGQRMNYTFDRWD